MQFATVIVALAIVVAVNSQGAEIPPRINNNTMIDAHNMTTAMTEGAETTPEPEPEPEAEAEPESIQKPEHKPSAEPEAKPEVAAEAKPKLETEHVDGDVQDETMHSSRPIPPAKPKDNEIPQASKQDSGSSVIGALPVLLVSMMAALRVFRI